MGADRPDELRDLLGRAPLNVQERARAEKLLRRLGRVDPEGAARLRLELDLPLAVQAPPAAVFRAGAPGLRAPVVARAELPTQVLGPALDRWRLEAYDRPAMVSALILARHLAAAEHGPAIDKLLGRVARGEEGTWPAVREVLAAWPGCCAVLGLPLEGPVGAPPCAAQQVRAERRAVGGERLVDPAELAWLWRALPDGLWVDLGCGDGATARALARPGRRVVGVDLLPGADVVLRPSRWPEDLHHAALAGVGEPADVALLCYPVHARQKTRAGRSELAVVFQVGTLLDLLCPGGVGVVVTESPGVMRGALETARARRLALDLVSGPVGAQALGALGIRPYAPRVTDLVGQVGDDRPTQAFPWGFVALLWAPA